MIGLTLMMLLGCKHKQLETYKGFTLDNVYHSKKNGDIHYNLYIPKSYDGHKAYALFMTLPGYQGLYFQGAGETTSLMLGKRADLFAGYLHASTKWDGSYDSVVENKTPVYIAIGEGDEYYGSKQAIDTYNAIKKLYLDKGTTNHEIDKLLVLDVKKNDYFTSHGMYNQHGSGANLFANDKTIMSWLFSKRRTK